MPSSTIVTADGDTYRLTRERRRVTITRWCDCTFGPHWHHLETVEGPRPMAHAEALIDAWTRPPGPRAVQL